jgi:3-carboxy-cis,cis-muconate cycloisomerase
MTVSLFDSAIFGELFADPEVRDLLSDKKRIEMMIKVEVALVAVLVKHGIIPKAAGNTITRASNGVEISPAALGQAVAQNGIPITALVRELRQETGREHADFVHWGATSQDIVDSAQVLICRDYVDLMRERLRRLIDQLCHLMRAHGDTAMAGRTRGQQAVPISFAMKCATWLAPLLRHYERLEQLQSRLLLLQFGGAAGSLAPFGTTGAQVMLDLAAQLGLGSPDLPWHSQRDGIAEFGSWLALLTGSLGKMGGDLVLLSQREVAEVAVAGGRSSTMPQKANPVGPETLVAGAALTSDLQSSLFAAMAHDHERGGPQMILEWASLPQMMLIAAANLNLGTKIIADLKVNEARMRQNIAGDGSILAEAATFALAQHIELGPARRLVASACEQQTDGDQRHLIDILAATSDAPVDWPALKEPLNYLGSAGKFVDTVGAHADEILAEKQTAA